MFFELLLSLLNLHALSCAAHFVEKKPPRILVPLFIFFYDFLGGNDRESANARKKARYREELQLQMREAEAARRRWVTEQLVQLRHFIYPPPLCKFVAVLNRDFLIRPYHHDIPCVLVNYPMFV